MKAHLPSDHGPNAMRPASVEEYKTPVYKGDFRTCAASFRATRGSGDATSAWGALPRCSYPALRPIPDIYLYILPRHALKRVAIFRPTQLVKLSPGFDPKRSPTLGRRASAVDQRHGDSGRVIDRKIAEIGKVDDEGIAGADMRHLEAAARRVGGDRNCHVLQAERL